MSNGLKQTSQCLGYQQISGTASASLTVPVGTTYAVIVCETNAIRWRDDGAVPTASVGMPLSTGVYLSYDGNFAKFVYIPQTGTAVLNISYYN